MSTAANAEPKNAKPKKRLGLLEGKLTLPDDFDAPLPPEFLAAFGGDTVMKLLPDTKTGTS